MTRRLVALVLWTYFAWYLGALVALYTDGPAAAGPIAGVMMALVVGYGWLRRSRRASAPQGTVVQSRDPVSG